MKRIIFSALVAIIAVGGAFASSVTITKSAKNTAVHVYYRPSDNCSKLTCDTNAGSIACNTITTVLPTILNSDGTCSNFQMVIGNIVPNP